MTTLNELSDLQRCKRWRRLSPNHLNALDGYGGPLDLISDARICDTVAQTFESFKLYHR